MAPKLVSLDDPTSLQSFVNSMRSRSHPSASSTQVVSDIQPAPNEELEQGEVMSPRSPSQPIDSEHLHEPSVPSPISEEQRIDPVPVSPPRQGLMPPQDTPQTAPASPLRVPAITSSPEQEPTSVGDAIYDYVQGIKGVPLTDSIWAPKHLSHRQSLLRGPRKTKKDLPPINDANPSLQTFTRMSSMVADSGLKPGMGHAITQTAPFQPGSEPTLPISPSRSHPLSSVARHVDPTVPSLDDQNEQNPRKGLNPNEKQGDVLSREIRQGNLEITRSKEMVPLQPVASDLELGKAHHADDPVGPNLSNSFLSKWGSKKTQTTVSNPTEQLSEGEISPETLAAKEFSMKIEKAGSPIQEKLSIGPPEKLICRSSSSSFILQDKTNTQQGSKLPVSQARLEEDRTNQVYFSSWGLAPKRDRPAAQIRTVHLSGLPRRPTTAFITCLVFGGPLEQIRVSSSQNSTTASVVFLYDADCEKFYDETSNGIVYGKDDIGREKVARVSLGKDVDVVSEKVMQYIAWEYTRCVKVVPLSKDYEKKFWWEYAVEKGRRVEDIELGRTKGGARYVIIRFADIAHAVQFNATLRRDVEFERCNITYAKDPCAEATTPRMN